MPDEKSRVLSPNERYAIAKREMTCPDCGSPLVYKSMKQADPKGLLLVDGGAGYLSTHVGLECTGFDPNRNPPRCKFITFAGEKRDGATGEISL